MLELSELLACAEIWRTAEPRLEWGSHWVPSYGKGLQSISPFIRRWAEATLGQRVTLTCGYEDVALGDDQKGMGRRRGFLCSSSRFPAQLFPIHNEIPHNAPAEFLRSAP